MLGSRPGLDPGDQSPLDARRAEGPREIGGEILNRHADPPTPDLAVAEQLIHHIACHVDRDSEADADIAAAWRQDRGVDADQPTLQIDERAAGVAWVDRGVGLNKILIAFDTEPTAAERADDPRGYGLAETERVADGKDEIPDLQTARIAHRHCRQIACRDLQHGNVGRAIAADQLGIETPVVLGRDFNAGRVFDDVAIGQYVALRGLDNDAGSDRFGLALDRLVPE